MASLLRLRAKRVSKANNGRLVGVLAASGGSGARARWRPIWPFCWQSCCGPTALIDLRAAASDLAGLLDLKPAHDLADLCRHVTRLDASMFQQSLVQHPSGVHLLAAPAKYDEIATSHPARGAEC